MNQNIKFYLTIVSAIILIVISFLGGRGCVKCPEPPKYRTEKQIIDSMLKVISHESTTITVEGKIRWYPEYIHDTTNYFIKDSMLFAKVFEEKNVYWDSIPVTETYQYILSKPFVSSLDTICQKDTVKIDYEFPENLLSVLYKPHADSIYVKTINNYIVEEKNWYIGAGLHFGAGFGGGFTGQVGISFQLGYKIWQW